MAESEIQSRFSPNTPLEPDILSEIHSILRLHDLSVEDLFFKWESYCIKMDLDAQAGLSLSSLRSLKQNLQDELEKSRRAAQVRNERKVVNATPKANSGGDVFGMLDGLVPSTPATGRLNRNAGGSALKRKMDGLKMGSSPGMSDQLKSMNGLPYVFFHELCGVA